MDCILYIVYCALYGISWIDWKQSYQEVLLQLVCQSVGSSSKWRFIHTYGFKCTIVLEVVEAAGLMLVFEVLSVERNSIPWLVLLSRSK